MSDALNTAVYFASLGGFVVIAFAIRAGFRQWRYRRRRFTVLQWPPEGRIKK